MLRDTKILNNCQLQNFVWDTIMSQKDLFNEEDIVEQIQKSGRIDFDYDSNRIKKLVGEKLALLMRLNYVSYSQQENKYYTN